LPNVGPYIYDVSISGFTRSSIYIYDISSLRVNIQWHMYGKRCTVEAATYIMGKKVPHLYAKAHGMWSCI